MTPFRTIPIHFPYGGKWIKKRSILWKNTTTRRLTAGSLAGIGLICLFSACNRSVEESPHTLPASSSLQLQATLSTNRIHIGDPVMLTLTATHPPDTSVTFPLVADGKNVLVRDSSIHTQEVPGGTHWIQTIQQMELTSLAITNHIVGDGKSVLLHTADGTLTNAYPFVALEVESSLNAGERDNPTASLRPYKTELRQWPAPKSRLVWVFLLVATIAFGVAWSVRKWLSIPRTILNIPPPRPAHEIALAALAELRAKNWIQRLNIEPFYIALSDIVRRYMENRFQLRAPELTTEEFIREAASSAQLSKEHQNLVTAFLEQSDLVKFARFAPDSTDMQHAFDSAEQLVMETMQADPKHAEGIE